MKATHLVRVDTETWEHLRSQALGWESRGKTIRRLLGLDKEKEPEPKKEKKEKQK